MIGFLKSLWAWINPQPDPREELLEQIRFAACRGVKTIHLNAEEWRLIRDYMDECERVYVSGESPGSFLLYGVEIRKQATP